MAYERKVKVTASLQDAYKTYRTTNKKLRKREYLDVCYDITEVISDMIIRESLEFKLPYRTGHLRIKRIPQKLKLKDGRIDVNKNVIDWTATWDAWYEMYPNKTNKEIRVLKDKWVIFQTNDHTDGQIMRWYWDKRFCAIKNSSIYRFKPVKGGEFNGNYRGRLGLAKWIKHDDRKNNWYE